LFSSTRAEVLIREVDSRKVFRGEVTKEFLFQNWLHKIVTKLFLDHPNDCEDSFYPRLRSISL
jgi:hemerythrin superfamily protein